LLLEDERRVIAGWIDAYQNLADLRSVSFEHPGRRSSRTGRRLGSVAGRGYPVPNDPAPPRIRINTLVWPTGATRWACGWFLAERDAKDEILDAAHGTDGISRAKPLVMSHPEGDELRAMMHLLPPRPISPADYSDGAWIVPLVDARFFWQDACVGDLSLGGASSWSTIFAAVGEAIGTAIEVGSIDAGYASPDPRELSRRYENAAALLDAVAHSLGHRVVVDYEGTVHSMDADRSQTRLDANLSGDVPLIAGDDVGPDPAPDRMTVTFPKFSHGVPHCDGDVYEITSDLNPELATGLRKTVHSTMFADFTGGNGPASPDNTSALTSLASVVTTSFGQSIRRNYDRTYAGVKLWEPTLWCDHVEIALGYQRPDGSYAAQTRVQSKPHNLRTEEQLSQDGTLNVVGHYNLGKIAGGDLGGNNLADDDDYRGSVTFWDGDSQENSDGNSESAATAGAAVFLWPKMHFYEGERVQTAWDCESNRHYVLGQPDDLIERARLNDVAWVSSATPINFAGVDTITNPEVFGTSGAGGIEVLIDSWVLFWFQLDPHWASAGFPTDPGAASMQLLRNGAAVAGARARLTIENGLKEGIGSSVTKITEASAGDVFTVVVQEETDWSTSITFRGGHGRFGARRLRVPAP
jgi:hypothetical protein